MARPEAAPATQYVKCIDGNAGCRMAATRLLRGWSIALLLSRGVGEDESGGAEASHSSTGIGVSHGEAKAGGEEEEGEGSGSKRATRSRSDGSSSFSSFWFPSRTCPPPLSPLAASTTSVVTCAMGKAVGGAAREDAEDFLCSGREEAKGRQENTFGAPRTTLEST